MKDPHFHSLLKAFSWRIAGSIATITLVFLFTGELKLSMEVGFVEFISKIGLFYLHERIWMRFK